MVGVDKLIACHPYFSSAAAAHDAIILSSAAVE
jgi:hypothetical protein